MIFSKASANASLHAGNAARDAGDWPAAVGHYRDHLAAAPDDAAIWVQLGNCAKEAGDFAVSLSAYERAVALRPREADTHLQLGHLHKRMGRPREAQLHYCRALERDPDLADARAELAALRQLVATLPFLLPPTFLDMVRAESVEDLIARTAAADPREDPFRRYAELLI